MFTAANPTIGQGGPATYTVKVVPTFKGIPVKVAQGSSQIVSVSNNITLRDG